MDTALVHQDTLCYWAAWSESFEAATIAFTTGDCRMLKSISGRGTDLLRTSAAQPGPGLCQDTGQLIHPQLDPPGGQTPQAGDAVRAMGRCLGVHAASKP